VPAAAPTRLQRKTHTCTVRRKDEIVESVARAQSCWLIACRSGAAELQL
jgi:hypothetical protein